MWSHNKNNNTTIMRSIRFLYAIYFTTKKYLEGYFSRAQVWSQLTFILWKQNNLLT